MTKINLNEDINSYSYTGPGFGDDRIDLARFSNDDGYVELVNDGITCYVTSQSFLGDYDFYREYKMSDIDAAIRDFNAEVKCFGDTRTLTRKFIDQVLSEYGKSLSDYEPGGFYGTLRKGD